MPKVLVVPVGKPPVVKTILSGLEPMQKLVGGYIEQVTLTDGLGLICNEEGKLQGLTPNRNFNGDTICGDFFLSRYNEEGETVDVTDEDIEIYSKVFADARY